jgi:hypothetical protein
MPLCVLPLCVLCPLYVYRNPNLVTYCIGLVSTIENKLKNSIESFFIY